MQRLGLYIEADGLSRAAMDVGEQLVLPGRRPAERVGEGHRRDEIRVPGQPWDVLARAGTDGTSEVRFPPGEGLDGDRGTGGGGTDLAIDPLGHLQDSPAFPARPRLEQAPMDICRRV